MTPIRLAPNTPVGYLSPLGIQFSIVDVGNGVQMSWSNTPFKNGEPANTIVVGKEYTADTIGNATPCAALSCVYDPLDGDHYGCKSQIWDSTIFYKGDFTTGITNLFIPYNLFTATWNYTGFATDGKTEQYYVELSHLENGAAFSKTKFLFDFTTPVAPFADPCAPVVATTTSKTSAVKGKK